MNELEYFESEREVGGLFIVGTDINQGFWLHMNVVFFYVKLR